MDQKQQIDVAIKHVEKTYMPITERERNIVALAVQAVLMNTVRESMAGDV